MQTHPHSLGIALSGGGARGIAHVGVLQALSDAGIHPQVVSGTSAGALMGVLYAAGKSPQEILEIVRETSLLDMFQPTWGIGLADLSKATDILAAHIPRDDFSALQKPFHVSLTNLSDGKSEIFSEGPLFEVVLASCSIPLLFRPRIIQEKVYVDGGLMNNLPVQPLKSTCQHVIGVNVTPIDREEDLDSMRSIGMRSLDLILWTNVAYSLQLCDIQIQPDADGFGLFALEQAEEIYQKGYEAAQGQLSAIRDLHIPDLS